MSPIPDVRLLTLTEVATVLRVDQGTVKRWIRKGKIRSIRTPGGHHRCFAEEIEAMVGTMAGDGAQ